MPLARSALAMEIPMQIMMWILWMLGLGDETVSSVGGYPGPNGSETEVGGYPGPGG